MSSWNVLVHQYRREWFIVLAFGHRESVPVTAVLWFLWRKMLSWVEKSQKWVSSPMRRLPTFKSFIKLQKPELILATAYNKNTAFNNWKGEKKRKYVEGGGWKKRKEQARSLHIHIPMQPLSLKRLSNYNNKTKTPWIHSRPAKW